MRILTITAMSLAAIAVSGCAMTTAGVKKGDERNFVRSMNDMTAGRAIKARMTRASDFNLKGVNVEVAEGIVVLTGNVPSQTDMIEAERIAWSAPKIDQVGNEISLKGKQGFVRKTKDSFLTSAIKTRLTADTSVKARNINIETHDGIVYLLGVARTPQELQRAAQIASTTKGTREVISYIKLAGAEVNSAGFTPPATLRTQPYQSYDGSSGYSAPGAQIAPYTPPAQTLPPLSAQGGVQGGLQGNLPRDLQGALPGVPSSPLSTDRLPDTEPYYRDPKTGERIILPPGTKTIPLGPNGKPKISVPVPGGTQDAPYYIDPSTGQKIQVVYPGF